MGDQAAHFTFAELARVAQELGLEDKAAALLDVESGLSGDEMADAQARRVHRVGHIA